MQMTYAGNPVMPEQWVVNASPLILLARVGCDHLLRSLPQKVVVPQAVVDEINAGPSDDAARLVMTRGEFQIIDTPAPAKEVLAWDLGAGETAVLSLALAEPGWIAILDDAAARKCARSFALDIKGTLAIVILARQHGLIPSAADLIRMLQHAGYRIDNRLVRDVLNRTVREQW
jgi:predicted nucleic acid-binding protein